MRKVRGWGVLTSAAAPVLLIGGWSAAARLQPESFDPIRRTISDLAALDAGHRWVMTAALTGVGAAHLGTALALRPAARAGRVILGTGGVATLLVAAFPLPGEGGSAPEHTLAAAVAFSALGAWPLAAWRRPSQEPVPWPFRPEVAVPAAGVLLATMGWFFTEFLRGGDQIGLSERAAAGAQALWPLVAVLGARRVQREQRRATS